MHTWRNGDSDILPELHSPVAQPSGRPSTKASQSPMTVSSLALAEDPCLNIYQWVCQKSGETQDPTGVVSPDLEGEKQAIRIYKEIIRQHPDWGVEKIDSALVSEIYNPKRRGRIEAAFHWVRHAIEKLIDQQPDHLFNTQEKQEIKDRLRKTQLQIPPPASVYSDAPDLLIRNEVYYERMSGGEMRLRVGGAYLLIAKSWFNLVFTFAHELAHSIDPCEVRVARFSFPAYDRLTACFLENGFIQIAKNRSECGYNDQLSEIYADWVAVQITAEALSFFSTEFHGSQILNAARNAVRDLCEQEDDQDEPDLEFHPSGQKRIGKIFGQSPLIRELLGCGPLPLQEGAYCSFENPGEHK
jgi:hypothetical protein